MSALDIIYQNFILIYNIFDFMNYCTNLHQNLTENLEQK